MEFKFPLVAFLILFLITISFIPCLSADPIIIEVKVGFDGLFRLGRWFPLRVILENRGEDSKGKLILSLVERPALSLETNTTIYSQSIDLPSRSRKVTTFYLFLNQIQYPLKLEYLSPSRRTIAYKVDLKSHSATKPLLLVVEGERSNGFAIALNAQYQVAYATVEELPNKWQGYDCIDAVILNRVWPKQFSQEQEEALLGWVEMGGTLIIPVGSFYKSYLGTFIEGVLPVRLRSPQVLSSLGSLARRYGGKVGLGRGIMVANSLLKGGMEIVREGNIPLIVKGERGLGRVIYLAFDRFSLGGEGGWSGEAAMWGEILETGEKKGEELKGKEEEVDFCYSLLNRQKIFFPSRSGIFLFLVFYLLFLGGPYYYLKKRKKILWLILLLPLIVLTFSLMSYSLWLIDKRGGKIVLNEVSLVDSLANFRVGIAETFFGSFSWSGTPYSYKIREPSASLHPLNLRSIGGQLSLLENRKDGILITSPKINLKTPKMFKVRSLIRTGVEAKAEVKGEEALVTVINNGPFELKEPFLLWRGRTFPLADLRKGAKVEMKVSLDKRGDFKRKAETYGEGEIERRIWTFSLERGRLISNQREYLFLFGWSDHSIVQTSFDPSHFDYKKIALFKIAIPTEGGQ